MKFIFVNRYFHPDHSATSQILSELAFALSAPPAAGRARAAADIHVIASRLRYDAPTVQLPARETVGGVTIHRVWTSRFGRHNLVGRAADYATFYLSAAWMLFRLARAGDVIIAKTDPPMLSVIAAPIARLRRAKLVNWLQDVFPEVAERLGVGRGRLMRLAFAVMRRLRNRSLRAAAVNVVLGERMAELLTGLNVPAEKIRIIPNWADGTLLQPLDHDANALRAAWGLSGTFVVGYSGNLGRAHDNATMLDAIEILERRDEGNSEAASNLAMPRIVWLFIGGGAQYDALKREVGTRKLSSVIFHDYQPREKMAESLSAADVHLVSLRPQLEGLIVPSKFYGIAAVGRPAIFIGDEDGEIARLVTRFDSGLRIAEGDGAALAQTVLALAADPARCAFMGANARKAIEEHYDKSIAAAAWKALLDEVAAGELRARQVAPGRSRNQR